MTKEQAIELAKSGFWKNLTQTEIFLFQINEGRLCMPFSIFHKATEAILHRPVFTHEFAEPELLRAEFSGSIPAPDIKQILDRLGGKMKLIVVGVSTEN